jgi:alpha-D-ribose 1-methylphosphonate 5-triphosphate synthase subunit PhnL
MAHEQVIRPPRGAVIDLATAEPRQVLGVRRSTIGYVSQFLRAVPRVATIDVVAEPLIANGVTREDARERAGLLLRRLNIPERLWRLPPSTFELIDEKKRRGVAMVAIVHDDEIRREIADRVVDVTAFAAAA